LFFGSSRPPPVCMRREERRIDLLFVLWFK